MFLNYISFFTIFLLIFLINCEKLNKSIRSSNKSTAQKCGIKRSSNIVHFIHGGRATTVESWPWQVHLKIADSNATDNTNYEYANCGASILSNMWLVTAAHCFSGRKNPKLFLLQGHNLSSKNNYKEVKYDRIELHEDYKEFITYHEYSVNDIALVKLNYFSRIKGKFTALCLPEENAVLPVNSVCHITGYGSTSKDDKEHNKQLREGKVTIKAGQTCIKTLQLEVFQENTMICAGKTKLNRANSCQGDSGGPLVCEGVFEGNSNSNKWYLFGITSFGALDCAYYSNSVYTKVSSYVKWIRDVTGIIN